MLLILGLGTAGLGWLLAAVGYWIRLFGGRGANRDRAEVARLRRWALVFTMLGALAVIFWVALDSTSRKEMLPPSVSLTRSLGQAATLTEPVPPRGGAAEVPVTVTFSDFSYPLPEKAGADTATGLLKVCATTKAVDPMGVVFSLAAQVVGNVVNADFFTAFQTTSLRNPLRPGHCASGVVGFPVPTGRSVQAVRYGVNGRVTWTVPERSATGEPTTT